MKKNLVIVESPAKSNTISKFLGKDYEIKASFGHIRDLPSFRLGVNPTKNFEPTYVKIKGKEKLIKELSELAQKMQTIYIATDPDREGEAIAWHIKESLKVPDEKIKRVVFNEITKDVILNAIENSRPIDENLVNAQQARRILDRLIGYKLSPILAKKIQRGLSAGRVQSAAVKIIYDREITIEQFKEEEYWLIKTELKSKSSKAKTFWARLVAEQKENQKIEITNQKSAEEIVNNLKKADYMVDNINKSKLQRNPYPPFITSTLQQEASKKYNWTSKKTMLIAQQLYEGLTVDGEAVGLITYMRTDSTRISDIAKDAAQELIKKLFGQEYLGKGFKAKAKKGVQDAHEAIRPTYPEKLPKDMEGKIESDHFKLYKLIWERFIASQMSSALLEVTQINIAAKTTDTTYFLRTTGNIVLFEGFTKLYSETQEDKTTDEDLSTNLPNLSEKELLALLDTVSEQKFTQPPPRYTEASLVKEMEEKGIGRPSTYAPTISLIQERKYVEKEKKRLKLTDLGRIVTEQLAIYFKDIIDLNFTAEMENKLDEIMEGKHVWQKILADFYTPFEKLLENANKEMVKINTDKPTDVKCDKCGSDMVIKIGRYGEFMACSKYPECKNAKSLKAQLDIPCPLCQKMMVEKKSKRGKIFYGCSNYPKCQFALWDKPINEKCPACNYSLLTEKKTKDVQEKVCPNCKAKFMA